MGRTPRDARRRALGQNFLVDDRVVDALIGSVTLDPARHTVLDLGAGRGAVTARLAGRAARVIAVELDPDWARALRGRFGRAANVRVVEGDALRVALPPSPFTVLASPPFALGTALLRRLLADGHGLEEAALLLQLEAARRLARGGRFAATWSPWFDLRVVGRVPARAFRPVPGVEGAILHVAHRQPALLSPAAFAAHESLVDAVFAAPGATVASRLSRVVGRGRARLMMEAAGVAPGRRPGELPAEAWAGLTRAA